MIIHDKKIKIVIQTNCFRLLVLILHNFLYSRCIFMLPMSHPQVVPAENMQMLGAEMVPGIPVSNGGMMSSVVQVVAGGVVGMSGSSPAPVPPPTSSSTTSILASPADSSPAKSRSGLMSSVSSAIPMPVPSSIPSPVATQGSTTATVNSPAAVASGALSGPAPALMSLSPSAHTAGLPVAHLISLIQQVCDLRVSVWKGVVHWGFSGGMDLFLYPHWNNYF